MFERFTDRARQVVVLSQEEARRLDHNYIGTEHLMLALLQGGGVAERVLTSAGVSAEPARMRVDQLVDKSGTSPSGHIPFTARSKKVLELALREALQLGHTHVGSEHLLLGLLREGSGVGVQVLRGFGVDLGRVRDQVVEILTVEGFDQTGSEADPEVGVTGPQERLVESLTSEVQRLRAEVDRLRAQLGRAGTADEPRSQPVPRLATAAGAGRGYKSVLQCSFCSEPQDRVAKLILGPGVYICDRCVAVCHQIIEELIPPPEPM